MMITRIFADDHGESHFSDIEVPLTLIVPAEGLPPMGMSPPIASTQVRFLVGPPALIAHDWHPAPARQAGGHDRSVVELFDDLVTGSGASSGGTSN